MDILVALCKKEALQHRFTGKGKTRSLAGETGQKSSPQGIPAPQSYMGSAWKAPLM